MSQEIVVLFTAKSTERILAEGGTSAWRLDRNHARQCEFAVCTRNAYPKWDQGDWALGTEAHHTAFLVGKISDVVPCEPTPENHEAKDFRFLIKFSEFARVNIPNARKGDRNPVKYTTLDDLEIDPAKLKWEPMPEPDNAPTPVIATSSTANPKPTVGPLSMAEAKKGLALTFNVPPEAIEITIRG
jgi:hypothetical protein